MDKWKPSMNFVSLLLLVLVRQGVCLGLGIPPYSAATRLRCFRLWDINPNLLKFAMI